VHSWHTLPALAQNQHTACCNTSSKDPIQDEEFHRKGYFYFENYTPKGKTKPGMQLVSIILLDQTLNIINILLVEKILDLSKSFGASKVMQDFFHQPQHGPFNL